MISRYDNTNIMKNDSKVYRELFKKRNVKFVNQYESPELPYPTAKDLAQIEIYAHVWKLGDRYYKLSDQYYGDPKLWWVLAWFNRAPTESHLEIGDIVDIPMPLERFLQYLNV